MKLLGLDYGDAKIGLAIGDTDSKVASPFKILKNAGWNNLFQDLKLICQKEKIEKIIIGMPINKKSPDQAKRVSDFIAELKEQLNIEVEFQDEQFTTAQASKLINNGKKQDDDIAAMLILQAYLDANFIIL
ncbi:Holliday junction resolvase RuvX [Candidatus Falkowbacteria bacterium]|nr:Holliday junction resolvase RuvX [Candidatus Falkowbacteria bacterium]